MTLRFRLGHDLRGGARTTLLAASVIMLLGTQAHPAPLGECGVLCPTDLSDDGMTDGADLGLLLAAWGVGGGCADINGDGAVDGADLGLLLAAWGDCPTCPASDHDCFTSGDPGCTDLRCCEAVCAVDRFCCDVAWDGACVMAAMSICGQLPCGNCPTQDCFKRSPTNCTGCNDKDCCDDVCDILPYCCAIGSQAGSWDEMCVALACDICTTAPSVPALICPDGATNEGEDCGKDVNGGCNAFLASTDCCSTVGATGCTNPDCLDAVCAVDSFCCKVMWDDLCAAEAGMICAALCAPSSPQFGAISCGESICGTLWADGGVRDTDWYSFVLETTGAVTVTLESSIPADVVLVGPPDCGAARIISRPTKTGPCGYLYAIALCAPAGEYAIVVAALKFDGAPCLGFASGIEANGYVLTLACDQCSACKVSDHDCTTIGGPGCTDIDCCLTVCAIDAFCCADAWDDVCVGLAVDLCDVSLPCPVSEHDCFSAGGPGCDWEQCCEAVCAIDPFCCTVAWDEVCVVEALELCGGDCPLFCQGIDEGEPCGADLNGGCNIPPPSSDCCAAQAGVGCDDASCESAVCALNVFCCLVQWDEFCALNAVLACPELCNPPPQLGTIACGQTICGTLWADGNFRDTDWYEVTFTEITTLAIGISAQMPVVLGLVNTGGVPDCALASELNPYVLGDACSSTLLEVSVEPGTWWIFVAPQTFAGFPCGSGAEDYVLTLECEEPGP